ncbi:MAG: hypothetical protein LLF83_01190 [Methanobacterium sp.]|nr:hypothetical protein [Methanobacterium sp.]
MENRQLGKKENQKLLFISYVGSILTYVIGLYFITLGYILAFIGTLPTLIFGIYLIKKGLRRHGLILTIFFFVWIVIYYYYLPH